MDDLQRGVRLDGYIESQLAIHRQGPRGCSCGVRGRCPDAAAAQAAAEASATPEDGER
jgi:hypothetical protein